MNITFFIYWDSVPLNVNKFAKLYFSPSWPILRWTLGLALHRQMNSRQPTGRARQVVCIRSLYLLCMPQTIIVLSKFKTKTCKLLNIFFMDAFAEDEKSSVSTLAILWGYRFNYSLNFPTLRRKRQNGGVLFRMHLSYGSKFLICS